ncbi:Zinc protease PQQL-like [Glycine soja]|uniref:Zinc protease PQQL-like n=1 Tax=Glycine soja TaxID=3848 RepID=A0A445L0B7_GLYSO|nr:Zinc protease PQQL-like [Glycine soja]
MQMAEETVSAKDRDPYTAFTNRVKELNYGNSYFFWIPDRSWWQDLLKGGTKPSGRSNYTLMIVLINAKMDLHLELQCLLGLPSLAICLHYYNVDSVEGAAMSGISPSPYQKFLKSVRPPSIPSYLGKDYIFTSLLHLSDNLNVTNIFLHYQLCIDADTLLKINN